MPSDESTIYAHARDGYIRSSNTFWTSARNGSAEYANSSATGLTQNASALLSSGRGGGTYYVYRSFMYFDTSGITEPVYRAYISLRGYTSSTGDSMVVLADNFGNLDSSDYNGIVGWSTSGTDGSGGGDNSGNITNLLQSSIGVTQAGVITTWNTSGYNNLFLNGYACDYIFNNDIMYIAILNYDYDIKDVAPTDETGKIGFYHADYTGTSRDPKLTYTLANDPALFFVGGI